jgi:aminoglycoside 6'-N-acetyltransferase
MYEFRPMTTADLPLVKRWLETPHVAQWWHDPAEQFDLVSGDLDHPEMAQFIVAVSERPFAYLQCYRLSDWNTGFGPQPAGTRGLDQFIGEADMVGRGHGSAFIRKFTEQLLADGTPRVLIDPAPANARAIRSYEKAGFARDRVVDTPDGPALLMVRNANLDKR